MSTFSSSENMFEQTYDMNEYMNDAFAPDSFVAPKNMSGHASHAYPPSTTSPSITYSESLQPSMSTMSHASGTSTASSAMGSPFLTMHQEAEAPFDDWSKDRWDIGVEPDIMQQDDSYLPAAQGEDYDAHMPYVQPGLVSNYPYFQATHTAFDTSIPDFAAHPTANFHVASPVPTADSSAGLSSITTARSHQSMSHNGRSRRPSIGSIGSGSNYSKGSPVATPGFEEDGNDRGRCPYPGCGRVFKDLRAHKLTHQSERPEKCPIEKCQYHIKGFARKYDQTRHTLTHYKGTMVCGFCPGSGSATEKSFNRADVFKRHLTSVHGVEQCPSNSRRKTPASTKKTASKDENREGKCSTCGSVFTSAQEFYNHLDDCVMKVLEKPEVSEAFNERHLTEISNDQAVKATLERNNLPTEIEDETMQASDDDDEDMEDEDDDASETKVPLASNRVGKSSRGMTRSKGGVPTISKGRRKRKDYPHSWGCGKEQMKMKKRVLCVFDGQRRLWKDEMMMDNDFEVRVGFGENKYVTDLDVVTLKKAQALHNATEEEKGKGPWLHDEEVTKLML